jgi:hypothetical protein
VSGAVERYEAYRVAMVTRGAEIPNLVLREWLDWIRVQHSEAPGLHPMQITITGSSAWLMAEEAEIPSFALIHVEGQHQQVRV